jgi:hypothetical protein
MSNNQKMEDDLVRRIDQALDVAATEGRIIDRALARQIAAAVHRGLGSELERFAGTGRIRRHQVARLELHYLTVDNPQMLRWRKALLMFITNDQREQAKRKGGGHDTPCS